MQNQNAVAVKEILAINGPHPPTFNGIRNAIEACRYDQGFGVTETDKLVVVVVFEDSTQESIPIPIGGNSYDEAYEAAEIAHRFGIPHDESLCLPKSRDGELEDL